MHLKISAIWLAPPLDAWWPNSWEKWPEVRNSTVVPRSKSMKLFFPYGRHSNITSQWVAGAATEPPNALSESRPRTNHCCAQRKKSEFYQSGFSSFQYFAPLWRKILFFAQNFKVKWAAIHTTRHTVYWMVFRQIGNLCRRDLYQNVAFSMLSNICLVNILWYCPSGIQFSWANIMRNLELDCKSCKSQNKHPWANPCWLARTQPFTRVWHTSHSGPDTFKGW